MTDVIDRLRTLAPDPPAVTPDERRQAEERLLALVRDEPRRASRRGSRPALRVPRWRRRWLLVPAVAAVMAAVALAVPALLDGDDGRVPGVFRAFVVLGPEDAQAAAAALERAAGRGVSIDEGTVVTVVRFVPGEACPAGDGPGEPDYRETFTYAGATSMRDTVHRDFDLHIIDIRTPEQMYIWSSDYPDGGRDRDGERLFKTIPPDPQADANVVAWTLGGIANQAIADLVAGGERLAKREERGGGATYRSIITVGALLDGIPRRERPEALEWFTSIPGDAPLLAQVTVGPDGLFREMRFELAEARGGYCAGLVDVDFHGVGKQVDVPVPTAAEIAGPHQ